MGVVEIIAKGQRIDVSNKDQVISYTMQVHDMADVSKSSASFTNSFNIEMTPHNIIALEGLGLIGSTSTAPYTKIPTTLISKGATLIKNGWLRISGISDNVCSTSIEDGITDFFKDIENKTLGADLDLSEINHSKTLEAVIASFETDKPYKYILADYNGKLRYQQNDSGTIRDLINVDYLVPSVSIKYLWDKIFSTLNYQYTGSIFDTEEFKGLYVTYPKAPPIEVDPESLPDPDPFFSSRFTGDFNSIVKLMPGQNGVVLVPYRNSNIIKNCEVLDEYTLRVNDSGTFRISKDAQKEEVYRIRSNNGIWVGYEYYDIVSVVYKNGVEVLNSHEPSFVMSVYEGDIIQFALKAGTLNGTQSATNRKGTLYHLRFHAEGFRFNLDKVSMSNIDFSEQLNDLSITDFFKEIMIRFSLTAFYDQDTKVIEFLTLDERFKYPLKVDYSKNYIKKKSEIYTYPNYAQRNYYRHKYNDPSATFNDGYIEVGNKNLDDKKDLYTSKIYSPNKEVSKVLLDNSNVADRSVFPLWEKEAQEKYDRDTDSVSLEFKYKGLSARYYFIRYDNVVMLGDGLGSESQQVYIGYDSFVPYVNTDKLSYAECVADHYTKMPYILNKTRIITVELNMSVIDLAKLNFRKICYLEQEQAYFILNRLTYSTDGSAEGEFIQLKSI